MKLVYATVIAALVASPSLAALNCAPASDVADILQDRYGESVTIRALSKRGYVMEIWSNAETGSWSYVAQRPDGVACIMDEGEAFQAVDDPAGEQM